MSHSVLEKASDDIADVKFVYLLAALDDGIIVDRLCRCPSRGGYVALAPVLPDGVNTELFRVVRYWHACKPTDAELTVYYERGFVVWHIV